MTPTTSSFPIEGSPIKGESLMGFVLRMSLANHVDGIQWLGRLMKKERIFHLSKQHVPTIAWIFGATVDSFENTTISQITKHQDTYWDFYSHFISRSYLMRHRTPQICPKCVEELGYIKKVWDLRAVTTCPHHRILLQDRCEGCGKYISWSRHSIFACSCHFDLRYSRTEQIPKEESQIAENIELIFDGCAHNLSVPNGVSPHNLLNSLSIDGTARLIHATGLMRDSGDMLRVGKSRSEIRTQEMHEITKRSIQRLSKVTRDEDTRKTCSTFLTSSLIDLEQNGHTQLDRDLAHQLISRSRKGLPNRASLLTRNPRCQLDLFKL